MTDTDKPERDPITELRDVATILDSKDYKFQAAIMRIADRLRALEGKAPAAATVPGYSYLHTPEADEVPGSRAGAGGAIPTAEQWSTITGPPAPEFTEFPRPTRDEAEREACDCDGRDTCDDVFADDVNRDYPATCDRLPNHTGKHVACDKRPADPAMMVVAVWPSASPPREVGNWLGGLNDCTVSIIVILATKAEKPPTTPAG